MESSLVARFIERSGMGLPVPADADAAEKALAKICVFGDQTDGTLPVLEAVALRKRVHASLKSLGINENAANRVSVLFYLALSNSFFLKQTISAVLARWRSAFDKTGERPLQSVVFQLVQFEAERNAVQAALIIWGIDRSADHQAHEEAVLNGLYRTSTGLLSRLAELVMSLGVADLGISASEVGDAAGLVMTAQRNVVVVTALNREILAPIKYEKSGVDEISAAIGLH